MKLLHRKPTSLPRARAWLALAITALTISCITASAFAFKVGAEQADNSAGDQSLGKWQRDIPRVGGGISAPRAISAPEPAYPQAARKAKKGGSVVLWCVVGVDGRVKEARVSKSLGRDFDMNAIDALRKWTFEPALKDGKPIAVQVNVEVDFRYY